MELYKYLLNFSGILNCEKKDGFEEKEKTYCRKNGYPLRVRKIDIGVLGEGFIYPELWLLERDDEKAREIFVGHYQDKMEILKQECEERCQRYEKIIEGLKV